MSAQYPMTTSDDQEAGYTITELLIVLAILGLIAAALSPQLIGRLDSSKVRAARLQLDTVSASLDAFYIDMGRYPTSDEGLNVLITPPSDSATWLGPYVKSARNLVDPWGQGLHYTLEGIDRPVLTTYGADKAQGGDGSAQDISVPEMSSQ